MEATKGPTLLVLDDIDGFFSANPLFAQKLVDLITKKPGQNKKDGKVGKGQPAKTKDETNEDDMEDEKAELLKADFLDQANDQSNTRTNGAINTDPTQAGLFAKRPVIFICDDAYSKGLKPIRTISHWFKLEKNMESLCDRLKVICKREVVLVSDSGSPNRQRPHQCHR